MDRAKGLAWGSVDRALLARLVIGIGLVALTAVVLAATFRAPIEAFASGLVSRFGGTGVFFAMLIVDSYAVPPLSHEPVLFFAHAGGLGFWKVTAIAGTGSFLAGPVGYGIGMLLGRVTAVQRQLDRSGVAHLMGRHGVAVVAIAAVTPIPFSASTYAAGAMRLPFGPFLLVCGLRYPKIATYLGVIAAGWALG